MPEGQVLKKPLDRAVSQAMELTGMSAVCWRANSLSRDQAGHGPFFLVLNVPFN